MASQKKFIPDNSDLPRGNQLSYADQVKNSIARGETDPKLVNIRGDKVTAKGSCVGKFSNEALKVHSWNGSLPKKY